MRDNLKKVLGVIILLIPVLSAVSAYFQWHDAGTIQRQLAKTRRDLREQRFKTDLADFNFRTDAATVVREAPLTGFTGNLLRGIFPESLFLLPARDDRSAIVVWKQDRLESIDTYATWARLHRGLDEINAQLDAACEAALSGPIQFNLDSSQGLDLSLPHLEALRKAGEALDIRMVVELHDGHPDAAWTNLFALTRLATQWRVEPVELSHLNRFVLANYGFNSTWQALQYGDWPDEKLAALQREWESADFLSDLPNVPVFQGASDVAVCLQQRRGLTKNGAPLSKIFKESMHAPASAIAALEQYWAAARYRNYGTFEDENDLLLFYRQREIELRHAIASSNWMQMRSFPGVTNQPVFNPKSAYSSNLLWLISSRNAGLRYASRQLMNQNSSLPACAAVIETGRRIIVTAIALERFRLKHRAYPQTLAELEPAFLDQVPADFMDGKPLRYGRGDDDLFTIYSVGLDCVDDGGKPAVMPEVAPPHGLLFGLGGGSLGGDIVWPRPAATDNNTFGPRYEKSSPTATKRRKS